AVVCGSTVLVESRLAGDCRRRRRMCGRHGNGGVAGTAVGGRRDFAAVGSWGVGRRECAGGHSRCCLLAGASSGAARPVPLLSGGLSNVLSRERNEGLHSPWHGGRGVSRRVVENSGRRIRGGGWPKRQRQDHAAF